jgi:hypothetical protein
MTSMAERRILPGRARPGAAVAAALLTLLVLFATTDERSFGAIPDGQEMLSAAAAVSRFFEIGISRDFANAPPRPAGDAVSRYGMGLSLVETAPISAARLLSALAPDASSTPFFVLVPMLCLAASAYALARALLFLGAGPRLAAGLGLALPFATPLWGYAGSDYSEPLQAALISCLVLAAVALREGAVAPRPWLVLAGLSAGFAVLTKSLLLAAVFPLLLTASLGKAATRDPTPRRSRGGGKAAPRGMPWALVSSFAALLLVWALLELARFGRLFGGYAGETFTYPVFTGLARLTVLPNKGLLFYAPLVLLAPSGFLALRRRDGLLAGALAATVLVVLLASAAWWAWDGQAGWGPRLLVPALPPLVLLAGFGVASGGRRLTACGAALAALGVAVNLPGALVPFPQVYALASAVPPQPIPEARAEGTPYEIERGPDGGWLATGPHHLSLTPGWWPPRVHVLLLLAKLRGGSPGSGLEAVALANLAPPFVPTRSAAPGPSLAAALSGFRWPFWGRSFIAPAAGLVDPYRLALRDQAIRAIDIGDFPRAARLGAELVEGRGGLLDPFDVAVAAEAALRAGRPEEADRLLARSADGCHPWINFVRWERGGDLSCIEEPVRSGFVQGLEAARAARLPLTGWARAAQRARRELR